MGETKNVEITYGNFPNEVMDVSLDIMGAVSDNEFVEGKHNPLLNITVHSDFMLMMLSKLKVITSFVHVIKFLDRYTVIVTYDTNKKMDIDLQFNNGTRVVLKAPKKNLTK